MTYSIIGRDPATGAVGGAVQSKFPGVASLVLHGDARCGIVHTQAFGNPDHGEDGLQLMRLGLDPDGVIRVLVDRDEAHGCRQIAAMGLDGTFAHFTGEEIDGWHGVSGGVDGTNSVAIGNSLSNESVLPAMIERFESASGDLTERLVGALMAGRDAGGEFRGQQAAGVLVVKAGTAYAGRAGRLVDIQVYDHREPIDELARCYQLHKLSFFPSNEADVIEIDEETARFLKRLLKESDLLDRSSDGSTWGDAEIAAMARFMGQENYDNRIRDDARIDTEVLADIRSKHGFG